MEANRSVAPAGYAPRARDAGVWDWMLLATFGAMVLGGLLLLASPDSPLVAWLNRAVGRTFYGGGVEGAESMRRWLYAVEGSTLAAFGVLGLGVVRTAFLRRERWARNAVALAVGLWYPLDTAASLVYGMWPNAVLNTAIAAAVLLPLLSTWREFGVGDPGGGLNGADARVARGTVVRWVAPAPREGWRGSVDRFFGPGTRLDEYVVQAGAVVGITAMALMLTARAPSMELSWWAWLILVVLTVDIAGGVVTNATSPAKRWYHRDELSVGEKLGFVGIHGLHLVLFTVIGGMSWAQCALFYALMLGSAELLLRIPLHLQRPVALSLYAGLLLLSLMLVPPATGLAWFLPLFFLKIEVSHLIREAPFRPA